MRELHEIARSCPRFLRGTSIVCVHVPSSAQPDPYECDHICGITVAVELDRTTGGLAVAATRAIDIDDVYVLPTVDGSGSIPDEWQSSATYNLEMAVRCPHCDEKIRTIRIVGLSRSQVAFTSTLPRKGRIAICPECDRILPVELSGML
jgi:hypothetical protein